MCKWGKTIVCRVPVMAADSHTGKARWDYKDIDSCLADKVNELNRMGKLTRSCCCGHGNGKGNIILQDGTEIKV